MLASHVHRQPAPFLACRGVRLRPHVRPNAFGNALGNSIVGQLSQPSQQTQGVSETQLSRAAEERLQSGETVTDYGDDYADSGNLSVNSVGGQRRANANSGASQYRDGGWYDSKGGFHVNVTLNPSTENTDTYASLLKPWGLSDNLTGLSPLSGGLLGLESQSGFGLKYTQSQVDSFGMGGGSGSADSSSGLYRLGLETVGTFKGAAQWVYGAARFANDQLWVAGNALTGGWLANNNSDARDAVNSNTALGNALLGLPERASAFTLRTLTGNMTWGEVRSGYNQFMRTDEIASLEASGNYLDAASLRSQNALNVVSGLFGAAPAARSALGLAGSLSSTTGMGVRLAAGDFAASGFGLRLGASAENYMYRMGGLSYAIKPGNGANSAGTLSWKVAADNTYFKSAVAFDSSAFPGSTGISYKVFQRSDIDWQMVRENGAKQGRGLTNAEAASRYGIAPILPDGSVATLHHSQQNAVGPLFEASTRYHKIENAQRAPLHPFGSGQHPEFPLGRGAGSLRESFQRVDSLQYWKWRGQQRLGQ